MDGLSAPVLIPEVLERVNGAETPKAPTGQPSDVAGAEVDRNLLASALTQAVTILKTILEDSSRSEMKLDSQRSCVGSLVQCIF